jgi:hypothetical protein
MKYFLVILSSMLLTACGQVSNYSIPDSVTAVKIRYTSDSIFIEHTQYGGFYTMPISGLDKKPTPNSRNTAPYREFKKIGPAAPEGSEIELKWNWVKATNEEGRLVIRNYEGKQVTIGPAAYLLNVDDYGGRYLGYAIVMPGKSPLVFYIKPETKTRRESPGFMGWRD